MSSCRCSVVDHCMQRFTHYFVLHIAALGSRPASRPVNHLKEALKVSGESSCDRKFRSRIVFTIATQTLTYFSELLKLKLVTSQVVHNYLFGLLFNVES